MNSGIEMPPILLFGLIIASLLAGILIGGIAMQTAIGADNNEPTSVAEEEPEEIGELDRNIDREAGVVCYSPRAYTGGMDCLPLNDTNLATTGDAT